MTPHQKGILKEPAKHVIAMVDFVTQCDENKLAALREACEAATPTNCGWDIYRAAQFLKNECATEIATRRRFRPSKAAKHLTERGFTTQSQLVK